MYQTQPKVRHPAAGGPLAVFVRMAAVARKTGLGRSTIYRTVAEDKFPLPVRFAKCAVARRRIDLEQWSAGCPTISHSAAPGPRVTDRTREVPGTALSCAGF